MNDLQKIQQLLSTGVLSNIQLAHQLAIGQKMPIAKDIGEYLGLPDKILEGYKKFKMWKKYLYTVPIRSPQFKNCKLRLKDIKSKHQYLKERQQKLKKELGIGS